MLTITLNRFWLLPALLLCLLCAGAKAGPTHTQAPPVLDRTKALVQTLKRFANAMRAKHVTVHSVSTLVGPVKEDWGEYDDLTPTDPDFSEGRISAASFNHPAHLSLGEREPDDLDLTLARGVVLSPDALKEAFGRWRTLAPPPEGNPYQIAYYPNADAKLGVAVFAELTGPAHSKGTRILSLTFRRDDQEEARRKAR